MSDDPVSLKEYLEQQIQSVRDDIRKSESQLNKRLEGMNEFRDTLKDQAARLITREEYWAAHRSMEDKLRSLELEKANFEGRAATIAGLVSVAMSVVVGVVIFVITRYIGK